MIDDRFIDSAQPLYVTLAETLPLLDDRELSEALTELLSDPDPAVRREAAELVELWLSK